jgi:DNA mismatch repair protein MutS
MHTVNDGPANQSYGLQVAALAGVPKSVITHAKKKLHSLEIAPLSQQQSTFQPQQLDLFVQQQTIEPHPVIEQLSELAVDDLSPRQALETLYLLKSLVDED